MFVDAIEIFKKNYLLALELKLGFTSKDISDLWIMKYPHNWVEIYRAWDLWLCYFCFMLIWIFLKSKFFGCCILIVINSFIISGDMEYWRYLFLHHGLKLDQK